MVKNTDKLCRTCAQPFEWGYDKKTEKWVMLEPKASDADLAKTFIDENGDERADHRDRHSGGKPALNVERLDKKKAAKVTSIKKAVPRKAATTRKKVAPRKAAPARKRTA
jgi:hypothetical protein